jgi:hypothetical protein
MSYKPKTLHGNQLLQAIQFSERLADAKSWIEKADDLINAANILETEVSKYWSDIKVEKNQIVSIPNTKCVQESFFLLIAYALENYLKALLIHRNQATLKGWLHQKLPEYLKYHDLKILITKTGFKINIVEEELLSRLTISSIWSARYPIPVDSDTFSNTKKLSDGKIYLTAYYQPKDIDTIHSIIDRLRNYVASVIGTTFQT